MKLLTTISLFIVYFFAPTQNSTKVLKKMYERYHNKWQSTFTFIQTTENYRNDSLVKTSTWYEAIKYPDNFRIDFDDTKSGNAVIFKKDSAYNFRKGKLSKVTTNDNDLTFLLGGMYFYPFDTVLVKLSRYGYNINKFHENKWQQRDVYVIGADTKDEKADQLWIDKKNLYVVRFIKYSKGYKEECRLSDHKKFGKGWSETAFSFFIKDKLVQKEKYRDCQANVNIDSRVFEPSLFGTIHWYNPQ